MMLGKNPILTELGPYHFRMSQKFSNISYTHLPVPWDPETKKEAATFIYDENTYPNFDDYPHDEHYNKTAWLPNQAAMGVWYGAKDYNRTKLAMLGLYNVVVDGMGGALVRTAAFTAIQQSL